MRIVLVEPQIPQNTGNIGRLCAGHGISLHLVEPLGFELSDRYLKRAGLDYWPHIDLHVHPSFDVVVEKHQGDGRVWFFSARAERSFWSVSFGPDDLLVFGREADGLPEPLVQSAENSMLCVPHNDKIRSLNLANTVAVAAYEVLRQYRTGEAH